MWSTRGRNWGFRFLRTGGLPHPLRTYEAAFAGIENSREIFRRQGDLAAIRFSDPEGRCDAAGRIIPQEFVLLAPANNVDSLEEAFSLLWPLVAEEYAHDWDREQPESEDN
ncbi:hypothetical protein SD72_16210 [Leucobacter komagatae]|uniref:Uncharacterized protein n=1 Tax=Leucobacter komagatae TaxID=55969 RepID=A0A0D0H2E1_9MICO|nr:hypothetical protein SD72_16210 [Leucobacter komagatae]